jgi:hypothetical protein
MGLTESTEGRKDRKAEIEQEDEEQAEALSLLSLCAPVQSLSVGRCDPEKLVVSVSHFNPRNPRHPRSFFLRR